MNQTAFISLLKTHNIDLSSQQVEQFKLYFDLLVHENNLYNLTAITSEEGVYEKHFYDSISPLFHISLTGKKVLDVGAGAGFPSLPLKIVEPSLHISVLDATAKKMHFIEKLRNILKLNNVNTIIARAEEYNQQQFDVVVARSVAALNILLELVSNLVKVGGIFIAYKGSHYQEELEASKQAIATLGFELIDQQRYTLPSDQSTRCNLYFKKIRPNDKIYPRSYSKIKSKPL